MSERLAERAGELRVLLRYLAVVLRTRAARLTAAAPEPAP